MTATTWDTAEVVRADENMEVRNEDLGGGMYVSFFRLRAGTNLGPTFKGLPEDMCQCPHWGFVTKGKVRTRTKEGEDIYEAGQAYYWAPGHVTEILEDTEVAQFSPVKEFDETLRHFAGQQG